MTDIPVYSYEDLRKKADEFLLKYNTSGNIPVPIEEIVEFDFKINIVPVLGLQKEFEVEGFTSGDLKNIYYDILVVEVKAEGDDSNRNRAKCRDGVKHFETLNARLAELGEPWRYHFCFLSPEDYTSFFTKVREKKYAGWKSELMQQLA